MQSKGNAPTAAQKRWREAVRDLGSVVSGEPAVIHHPVGATGKHNKVHIGHWWLIPLTDEEHKSIDDGEKFGYERLKDFEKYAFQNVIDQLSPGPADEILDDVYKSIMSYHR